MKRPPLRKSDLLLGTLTGGLFAILRAMEIATGMLGADPLAGLVVGGTSAVVVGIGLFARKDPDLVLGGAIPRVLTGALTGVVVFYLLDVVLRLVSG